MPSQPLFQIQLVLGYLACLLLFGTYVRPWLQKTERADAMRAIATFHSFRFFGLVFLLPGVIGPNLPASFATTAAWGDFATGVLALLALLTFRQRPLFWLFAVAFNVVGIADLVTDYYDAVRIGLPAMAGQLGAAYAIPMLYVPMLMITHIAAFIVMLRAQPKAIAATAS